MRGNTSSTQHWHITAQGQQRFITLQMPKGIQGFAEAVAGVPVAGLVMIAGTSLSRWGQRKALAKPANPGRRGTSTD